MDLDWRKFVRTLNATLFFVLLGVIVVSLPAGSHVLPKQGPPTGGPADSAELSRYERCRALLRVLLTRFPHAVPEHGETPLLEALQRLQAATANWASARGSSTEIVSRSRESAEIALMRILSVLDASAETVRVWQPEIEVRKRWPSRSGVLILRFGQPGAETDIVPDFVIQEVDAGSADSALIEVPQARTVYAAVLFYNVASGAHDMHLRLSAGGKQFARVNLTTEVPASGRLKVECLDARTGEVSAAVIGLYSSNGQLAVPPQALSFEAAGFRYQQDGFPSEASRVRPYQQVRYWPGSAEQQRVFFVDGKFDLELLEGDYILIVGKGFEYAPQLKSIHVQSDAERTEVIRLDRWIDMPSRGWYSGDGHVHYERMSPAANERLLLWSRAEDVHVTNVMRMGDALQTYFEQYQFGTKGRYVSGDYAIVPGQEDPRTSSMGHTLHMDLQAPVRIEDDYYLYDPVFDAVRRMGGLSGYVHVYQPAAMGLWVQRDMTMNIARNKVDFAEISEFGDIDARLYYEFLNLGFRLTASAGSDVPWGHSIGVSRVYAYTGPKFDVDSWFRAVRAGHTFVTTGPMIELTVNGRIPGSEIQVKPGDELQIRARATGLAVLPRYLEIVSQGDVVRAAPSSADQKELEIEFSMPVKRSTWLAARSFGAHTSPIYVRVGEGRFWKLEKVEELIRIRMKQLDDVEELIREGIPAGGGPGNWSSPEVLRMNAGRLLERLTLARAVYQDLLRQAKRELAAESVGVAQD